MEFTHKFEEVFEFAAVLAALAHTEVEVVAVAIVVFGGVECALFQLVHSLGERLGDEVAGYADGLAFGVSVGYELVEFGYEVLGLPGSGFQVGPFRRPADDGLVDGFGFGAQCWLA